MILTTCAACAAPLAHTAPRCVRCWTRYCDSTCQGRGDVSAASSRESRLGVRGVRTRRLCFFFVCPRRWRRRRHGEGSRDAATRSLRSRYARLSGEKRSRKRALPARRCVECDVEIKFGRPTPSTRCRLRSCVYSMAWSHVVHATASRWTSLTFEQERVGPRARGAPARRGGRAVEPRRGPARRRPRRRGVEDQRRRGERRAVF